MLKRMLRKVRYAVLLAKVGGLKVFFHQLKRQIYSRASFIGLERNLGTNGAPVPCGVEYSLQLASEEDMEEVLQKAKTESKESAHELVQRRWFYESGFSNCYVARTIDTGELCYMVWLISSVDRALVKPGFRDMLPRLKANEMLIENSYTFEKYRGNRIMPSAMVELCEIARRNGYKRVITYVSQDNIASLKGCQRAGFKQFEEIPELKLFFITKRGHR